MGRRGKGGEDERKAGITVLRRKGGKKQKKRNEVEKREGGGWGVGGE